MFFSFAILTESVSSAAICRWNSINNFLSIFQMHDFSGKKMLMAKNILEQLLGNENNNTNCIFPVQRNDGRTNSLWHFVYCLDETRVSSRNCRFRLCKQLRENNKQDGSDINRWPATVECQLIFGFCAIGNWVQLWVLHWDLCRIVFSFRFTIRRWSSEWFWVQFQTTFSEDSLLWQKICANEQWNQCEMPNNVILLLGSLVLMEFIAIHSIDSSAVVNYQTFVSEKVILIWF